MNFNYDHDSLPAQLIPPDEQTPEGLAFVRLLLKALKTLYNRFIGFRADNLYKLKFNFQVIYLEKLLNDQFNNGAPAYTGLTPTGIYIGKPLSNLVRPVLRRKDELRPRLVMWGKTDPAFNPALHHRLVIRTKTEYYTNIDFIVWVPYACFNVNTDLQQVIKMKGWIKFYNDLADYQILNY